MKIIDKNKDYYDFYSGIYRDDSLTFDRTNSFILTKDQIASNTFFKGFSSDSRVRHAVSLPVYGVFVMQICNTFWLFLVEATEVDKYYKVKNCNITMLSSWTNYNKERKLISIESLRIPYPIIRYNETGESILKKIPAITQAIDHNNYDVWSDMAHKTIIRGDGKKEEKDIPILKESGIASLIDPLDIYLALEEYFSSEKTASERRESVGLTDSEKIENHGFDKKTSFRG